MTATEPATEPRKLYVAGPMTGVANYNFAAFAEASARLRAQGYLVVSPAEHDAEMGWVTVTEDNLGGILAVDKDDAFSWAEALDWDLRAVERCDGVYLLPGWSRSRGACREYEYAVMAGKVLLGATEEADGRARFRHQPLVGLVGFAQAGKDSFAAALGYQRLAFADPLKDLAAQCNPRFGGVRLQKLSDELGWEFAKRVPGVREFLQDLGAGVRETLGPDTWVKATFRGYDPTLPTVLSDVRFPNEIAAVQDRGGVIVRIDRPGVGAANGHVSETAWNSVVPDFVVLNDGDLGHLADEAEFLRLRLEDKAPVAVSR